MHIIISYSSGWGSERHSISPTPEFLCTHAHTWWRDIPTLRAPDPVRVIIDLKLQGIELARTTDDVVDGPLYPCMQSMVHPGSFDWIMRLQSVDVVYPTVPRGDQKALIDLRVYKLISKYDYYLQDCCYDPGSIHCGILWDNPWSAPDSVQAILGGLSVLISCGWQFFSWFMILMSVSTSFYWNLRLLFKILFNRN